MQAASRNGFVDAALEIFNRRIDAPKRDNEFWALQGVSFDLRRGECLGIIGRNGAGKSTLLKVLAGLSLPDKGTVRRTGSIEQIINVSSNLNPLLTGDENLLLAAAKAGIGRKDLKSVREEVVDFAEASEFIGRPVLHYSSGMKSRLGFALSTLSRPDILLLDEVLAVGDLSFRLKCYDRIFEMIDRAAVVYVSHSLSQISRICSRPLSWRRGNCHSPGRHKMPWSCMRS